MDKSISHPEQTTKKHAQPNYLAVFIALAVLTALEVAVTYLPIPRVPVLVPLAVIKAGLVVLYYMHLRSDSRVYSFLFLAGLLFGCTLLFSLILIFGRPVTGI